MCIRICIGSAALFALALFAGALGGYSRDVDSLRLRLEDSDSRLRLAQGDLSRIRSESRAVVDELDRGTERTLAELGRLRERVDSRDVDALHREILEPSVQVNAKGGVGGGTLLHSSPGHTYVVTAFHVIQKTLAADPGSAPIEVRLYDAEGALAETVPGELVASHEAKDLALLKLRTGRTFAGLARLASRETLRRIRVFEPVYAVGCPLGHDPLPTPGEVATLHKEVGGENFWMMNAPTIFGNSGGGIFHRETREMIGVSVMVCTYDGAVSTPVPHLGILVSLDSVYDWLDSIHYDFIYDPTATVEACERARREAAPPAAPPASQGTRAVPSSLDR